MLRLSVPLQGLALVLGVVFMLPRGVEAADKAMNPYVLKVIQSYPVDGTHGYWWPKDGAYDGTTCDLVYQGQVVARGEAQKRAYCCGLTFEVFFRAWELASKRTGPKGLKIGNLSAAQLKKLRADWYCAAGGRRGPVDALVPRKLAVHVVDPSDARPGDFVQLWRKNNTGHSVVFLGWLRQGKTITGIRYWSTQKSTNGIGERREHTAGKSGVDLANTHIARAFLSTANASR